MNGMDGNPLAEADSKRHQCASCTLILMGATGDLAARKIAPALYNLWSEGLLNKKFAVLGVARRPRSDQEFRQEMLQAISKHSRQEVDQAVWEQFASCWHYCTVEVSTDQNYAALAQKLDEMDALHQTGGRRLFYLATTPDTFEGIVRNLGNAGLNRPPGPDGFSRIVVEKPFGHDLPSARSLNETLLAHFDESQIFRIDHYLGKESVQNLLALRFANSVFEPLLNNRIVDHVQITASETSGMEGRRGPYYEQAGALRDMVQNHLLQVLALIAMDVPLRLDAKDIRDEKAKVLRAIAPMAPQEVALRTVRGQYGPAEGVEAYRQESGVGADSQVETFVALKLFIDNWRWSGVPFYLRTGKRLAAKASYVVIVFKREPVSMFSEAGCDLRGPNRLVIRIHPDEGFALVVDAKVPGPDLMLRPVKMDFRYAQSFAWASPEAYEHLLLDAMLGDAMLFIRNDEVEASWRVVDSIRNSWLNASLPRLIEYTPGSWGPPGAQELFSDPYMRWYE